MSPQSELTNPEAVPCEQLLNASSEEHHGHGRSSMAGAIFNFTNSIIGAGAIGLGGAMALSGGAISVFFILFFALLTKMSLDLVIRLSAETEGAHGSYEDLAQIGLGWPGKMLIVACKLLYSFGCLVAYIVVVKDNFASALRHLIYGHTKESTSILETILLNNAWTTWILSFTVMLPLCLLRDMSPLEKSSFFSVVCMVAIVAIVLFIFFDHPEIRQPSGTFSENWLEIKPGVLER